MASGMPPVPPQAGKKTSPLVWVALGCGGLLVATLVVVLAFTVFIGKKVKDFAEDTKANPAIAAAKVIASLDPDIEVVSTDEDGGTITLRNVKTGEVMTFDASDVKRGKIRFSHSKGADVTLEAEGSGDTGTVRVESGEGTMSFSSGDEVELPSWLPAYPGSVASGRFGASTGEGTTGTVQLETTDRAGEVLDYYQRLLQAEGFSVDRNTFERNGELAGGMLSARNENRSVNVSVTVEGKATHIGVGYQITKAR